MSSFNLEDLNPGDAFEWLPYDNKDTRRLIHEITSTADAQELNNLARSGFLVTNPCLLISRQPTPANGYPTMFRMITFIDAKGCVVHTPVRMSGYGEVFYIEPIVKEDP